MDAAHHGERSWSLRVLLVAIGWYAAVYAVAASVNLATAAPCVDCGPSPQAGWLEVLGGLTVALALVSPMLLRVTRRVRARFGSPLAAGSVTAAIGLVPVAVITFGVFLVIATAMIADS
jgi:hypothetical protein